MSDFTGIPEDDRGEGDQRGDGADGPVTPLTPEEQAGIDRMFAVQHVLRGCTHAPLEWLPFRTELLPEPCRSYVRGAAAALGCDEACVALPLLSALAGVVGNARSIRIQRDWEEPAVVWTASIGDSGTLKTPGFNLALRPLRALQSRFTHEHSEALADFQRRREEYRAAYKEWHYRSGRAASPEEAAALQKPSEPRKPPPPRRLIVNDVSLDVLVLLLSQNPRGVLLARDELSGWLASFDSRRGRRGNDIAHWLSMYGACEVTLERRWRKDDWVTVPRAAVSITGTIQPEVLRAALGRGQTRDGCAARFLLAHPPRRDRPMVPVPLDERLERDMERLFSHLCALEPEVNAWGEVSPRPVPLSREGRDAWDMFYREWANNLARSEGEKRAAIAKSEGYAARLALLFHLVRAASGAVDPERIDGQSVTAGATVAAWFGREATRIIELFAGVRHENEGVNLFEWIRRRGGVTTIRDLMRGPREFRSHAAAEEALDTLERLNVGVWRGRRSTRTLTTEFVLLSDSLRNSGD